MVGGKSMSGHKKLDIGDLMIKIILILFALICLSPWYYILMVSVSDPT